MGDQPASSAALSLLQTRAGSPDSTHSGQGLPGSIPREGCGEAAPTRKTRAEEGPSCSWHLFSGSGWGSAGGQDQDTQSSWVKGWGFIRNERGGHTYLIPFPASPHPPGLWGHLPVFWGHPELQDHLLWGWVS